MQNRRKIEMTDCKEKKEVRQAYFKGERPVLVKIFGNTLVRK